MVVTTGRMFGLVSRLLRQEVVLVNRVHKYEDDNPNAWSEFIQAMHSGQPFECDEDMFYYWLEVLPPVYMGKRILCADGVERLYHFAFAEGAEPLTVFWREGPSKRDDVIQPGETRYPRG